LPRRRAHDGWDEGWSPEDVQRALAPYVDGADDRALAASYGRLADCAPGSLGRRFFDFYDRYRFSFPGNAAALNEHFATHHDATHLLSGYNTSLQGELLVSTFASTMPVPTKGDVHRPAEADGAGR
jgi:hypothetical protein